MLCYSGFARKRTLNLVPTTLASPCDLDRQSLLIPAGLGERKD